MLVTKRSIRLLNLYELHALIIDSYFSNFWLSVLLSRFVGYYKSTSLWVLKTSLIYYVFSQMFRKDLLQLDFENVLKYFRVTLPKKCRNEEVARQVIKLACSLKMKKIRKYEQEFIALKGWCYFGNFELFMWCTKI